MTSLQRNGGSGTAKVSDPAIEAAQRAWDNDQLSVWPSQNAEAGAREMAKPIRELHDRWNAIGILPPEAWQILDQLAPLIFTSEELER